MMLLSNSFCTIGILRWVSNYVYHFVLWSFFCTIVSESKEIKRSNPVILKSGPYCLFDKIVKKEVPCEFIHEDDICVSFYDLQPQAPVHFLVVPKKKIRSLHLATEDDTHTLGHMIIVAKKLATKLHIEKSYRVVINNGRESTQTAGHLHLHVLGGRIMHWPPG